jgi:hypothetical protein
VKEDLVGRVERLHLSVRNSLYPVFEAVSNSIQAIEATGRKDGLVTIDLRRSKIQARLDLNTENTEPIEEIKITDNGEGFTDDNMNAFEELDTRHKIALGAKGVGRLTWLKVFKKTTVVSIYASTDGYRQRTFEFMLPNGVVDSKDLALTKNQRYDTGTIIVLSNPSAEFDEMTRYGATRIAAALVRHFLNYLLLLQNPPKIELSDGDATIPVQVSRLVGRETSYFEINKHKFSIEHLKIRSPDKAGHLVYYTAARRTVKDEKLKHLPNSRFAGPDGDFYYQAYVASPYLDTRVNQLRTDFAIEEDEPDLGGVSWNDLRAEIKKSANQYLDAEIKELGTVRDDQIDRVINQRIPELAYVREYNATEMPIAVPFGASDTEVEEVIGTIHLRNQKNGRELLANLVSNLQGATTLNLKTFEDDLSNRIEKITGPNQASLASYLLFRRAIIGIYRELLKKSGDRFQLEAAIHKLLFPMGTELDTSKSFRDHNLWLLDERLTFANYIASDYPLKNHRVLFGVNSPDEPDIVCYYNLGFSEDDPAEGELRTVMIVELKRPGPIGNRDENPYQQTMRYIRQIREGTWGEGGQKIKATDNTRFYCLIVCDLDQKMLGRMVEEYQLKPIFDGVDGYVIYNDPLKAYVEFIPFEKVLRDAERKHRAFFDRLGLFANSSK